MFNYESYDREQLYAEVWAEPVTTVAARYGVSDVMLKKACKKLKVPTPGRGYWQKVKAGARIARPPLPKYDGRQVMRTGNPGEYADDRRRHEAVIAQVKPEKTGPAIKVSGQLRNPHPLVEKAQERFREIWSVSREKDPVVHLKANYLNIRVAKSSAHRALRIMDAVVKALTGQGHRIGFQESWKRTYVVIDGEEICFILYERLKQVPHTKTPEEIKDEKRGYHGFAPAFDQLPTGLLTLSIDYPGYLPCKRWGDTVKRKLEDRLDEFVAGLKLAAAHARLITEKRREEERLREEARERERLAEELRAEELEKFEELEEQAGDWHRARVIREYIDAMEAALDAGLPEEELARRREYIAWAREKVAWLDPLVAKEDRILGKREPEE